MCSSLCVSLRLSASLLVSCEMRRPSLPPFSCTPERSPTTSVPGDRPKVGLSALSGRDGLTRSRTVTPAAPKDGSYRGSGRLSFVDRSPLIGSCRASRPISGQIYIVLRSKIERRDWRTAYVSRPVIGVYGSGRGREGMKGRETITLLITDFIIAGKNKTWM